MLWLSIDYHSDKPVYQQIYQLVKQAIMTGQLSPDEPMPSIREMAKSQNINPNTVARSYRELESDGLIYSRPGIGSFVRAMDPDRIEQKAAMMVQEELSAAIRTAQKYQLSRKTLEQIIKNQIDAFYGGD